jgi:ABC-type glycerol-3-phosphate transport system substrate-binding protein
MRLTRTIAALLAILMLLSCLAACGEAIDDPAATTAGGDLTDAVTETTAETVISDDLPTDLFYDGDKVVFLSRYREGWTSGEIAVEGLKSEPVNDAVYERNKAVEERLGVEIVSIEEPGDSAYIVVDKAALAVQAGTHEYDVLAAACYTTLNQSISGTFADLRKSLYLDLDKPYWSQGFNEVVEYHGAQFAITGDALLSLYRFAFVTIFNKALFTDANQPFLYEAVENGEWTLDKQISLVPIFHQDNGNGEQDEEGDIYGLVSCDYVSTDPYWSSCMVDIIKKDANGDYEFVFDSGKLHSVGDKVLRLFFETEDGTYDYKMNGENLEQISIRDMFARGDAAMATLRILELESEMMRGMEDEFGVVPMPKFDEAQTEYRTLLHDQFTVFSVLNTVTEDRLDEVGAVLEAMASVSYRTVRPAYYETTLRTQIAKDPQSAEMFDLIIDNTYMDAGILYTIPLSTFHDNFRRIIGSGKNTVSSDYKRISTVTQKSLRTMCGRLDRVLSGKLR